jgi:hypothetical protein
MQLVNASPLPVRLVRNAEEDRVVALFVVAATFRATGSGLVLAREQAPIVVVPPTPTVGDASPSKEGVSVCVTGFVYPGATTPGRGEARLRVGDVTRVVAAFGPRVWREGAAGRLEATAPLPFDRVEMSWANAFGGGVHRPTRLVALEGGGEAIAPEHDVSCPENPDGVGFYPEHADAVEQPLPALEDASAPIARFGDRPTPACFAPYPIYGGLRAAVLARGSDEIAWAEHGRAMSRAAPWTTFAALPAGTRVAIEGMRARGEAIAFEVPEPPVDVDVVVGPHGARVALATDAVDVDAEAATVRVLWRAFFSYPLVRWQHRVTHVRATPRFDAMIREPRATPEG